MRSHEPHPVSLSSLPTPPPVPTPARVWGFWLTLAFSGIALGLLMAVQLGVGAAFVAVQSMMDPSLSFEKLSEGLMYNGLYLTLAGLLSAPVGVAAVALFAGLRRGLPISEYLGLQRFSALQCVLWTVVLVGYEGSVALLGSQFQEPGGATERFMAETYASAVFPPLFWFSVIVCIPLAEEFLFRGFMFRGLASSRVGVTGAILLTAASWSALHVQYELFTILAIFGMGIILGLARRLSQSLWTPVTMHMTWNALATIQTALYLNAS